MTEKLTHTAPLARENDLISFEELLSYHNQYLLVETAIDSAPLFGLCIDVALHTQKDGFCSITLHVLQDEEALKINILLNHIIRIKTWDINHFIKEFKENNYEQK